ncbi:LAGLIDADG family homing endonuclease [Gracilibacillus massiliensis]|uniref:LAGLIDADG family homing endonuclease n=1 Tax=Gracilibacillus massiliensis TaxID=1564956 RepID=UPI00071CA086|nr:LAGLIDADG family homing endonuclease [Gracilibacillus massiliensis]
MEVPEAAYLAGIIDGEGTITLTRIHKNEYRRPCVTIASTDLELLEYLQTITNGNILNKKNYKPDIYKDSYILSIRKKVDVFYTLTAILPYLRIEQKRKRAEWILKYYDIVTVRNGKYTKEKLIKKIDFKNNFFTLL